MKKLITYLGICLLLTGCGFSPRSSKDVPPQLHVLYMDAFNPDAPVVVQLERTLQSVHVHFVDDPQAAPVVLRINGANWTTNIPPILNSGFAVTYSYTLQVTYHLQTRDGVNITSPKTISVTRSLIQNANQIYTPNATDLMRREITRTVVILMYHDLMSLSTHRALNDAFKTKHGH